MLIIKRKPGEGFAVLDAVTKERVADVTYTGRAEGNRARFTVRRQWRSGPEAVEIEKGGSFFIYTEAKVGRVYYSDHAGNQAVLAIAEPNNLLKFLRHEIENTSPKKEATNAAAM